MCEDYPARVIKARNDLRQFIRKAKSEGKEAFLRYGKLIIEDDAFVYDENNETIGLTADRTDTDINGNQEQYIGS